MVKLKIKVTKDILKKSAHCGIYEDERDAVGHNCAIALAVREIFPHAWVCRTEIAVYRAEEDILDLMRGFKCVAPIAKIYLPINAQWFIMNFDMLEGQPSERLLMEELEFEVEIPDVLLETINIDELREILKNSSTLELKEV